MTIHHPSGGKDPAPAPLDRPVDRITDRIDAAQESVAPPVPNRWKPTKVIAALLAVLFFGGPAIARVLGDRPKTIENHALAPFPSLRDGWDFFPELTTWATDHLPLRDRAVRANNEFSQNVFQEMPATAGKLPEVLLGKDGWLFYNADITNACATRDHISRVSDNATHLARIVAKASGSFTLLVAPNKSTIETDKLPDRYPQDHCAADARAALWHHLASTPPPGYVDLLGPISAVKREHGTAYLPQDTHWADFGRIQYATVLAEHFDPGLMHGTTVTPTGTHSSDGDLNTIRGLPGPTISPAATLTRAGVTTRSGSQTLFNVSYTVNTSTSTDASLLPGRTVLIGDSFSHTSLPAIAPFYQELVFASPNSQVISPKAMAELLLSANRVIFEEVERFYVGDDYSVLSPAYLDQVERLVDQARGAQAAG